VAGFIGEANFLDGHVSGVCPDGVLVEVGPLRVLAAGDGQVAKGAAVTISVRPEHVKLRIAEGATPNRWEARVQDVTFMGSVVRARIALGGGLSITAELQNDAAGGLAPGMAVSAGWSPRHSVVLVH
jgi:ABC-type Fe3+/spermidine/putrescine transport system ATPase subunit